MCYIPKVIKHDKILYSTCNLIVKHSVLKCNTTHHILVVFLLMHNFCVFIFSFATIVIKMGLQQDVKTRDVGARTIIPVL